ncbi:MAG: 7TM diverse intracellular signaling domain-containing protein [Bacteroidota bacterium]
MLLILAELGLYRIGKAKSLTEPIYTQQEYAYHTEIQVVPEGRKYFYQDPTAKLNATAAFQYFQQGRFTPLSDRIAEKLQSRSTIWVYFSLYIEEAATYDLVCLKENRFNFGSPIKTTFYQIDQGEVDFLAYSGGKCNRYRKSAPFKDNDWCVAFRSQQVSDASSFLVKIEKKRKFKPTFFPYLSSTEIENAFEIKKKFEQRHKRTFALLFVGLLLYFFVYILIQYGQVKDQAYLWYALYLLGLILYHGEQLDERFRVHWIFDHIVEWHDYFRAFMHTLTGVAYTFFVIHFLDFKRNNPTTYRLLSRLIYMLFLFPFLAIVIGWYADHVLVNRFIRNYNIVLMAIVVYLLVIILRSRSKQKKQYRPLYSYIIIGTFAIMIGGIANYSLGYLDQTAYLNPTAIWGSKMNYVRLGILVENICFMLGLSYKARLLIEEKSIYETKMNYFEKRTEEFHQQALRARISAHTATNIMKDIKSLHQQKKHKEAEQFSSLFSTFLRAHYEQSLEKYIPLEKELNSIRMYTELRTMSPDKKIQLIEQNEDVDLAYHYVPPGILLPIVENALDYAFDYSSDNQLITIELREDIHERLKITISDNGKGIEATDDEKTSKKSTGLLAVQSICEQEGIDFKITNIAPSGTSVSFLFKEELT